MLKKPISLALVFLYLLTAVHSASATTLTFDELDPSPASYDAMPALYNGFVFAGWYYGPDTLYTPASGAVDLFTDYADPSNPSAYTISEAAISSTTQFYFDGASFSGYSGVTMNFWKDGALVASTGAIFDAPGATPYGPTFLPSNYDGLVDTVTVKGVQGYYAMDNFTYHAASAVPEPESYAMYLLALGVLGAIKRKKTVK